MLPADDVAEPLSLLRGSSRSSPPPRRRHNWMARRGLRSTPYLLRLPSGGGGAGVRPIVVLADEGIPTLNHGPDRTRGQKMVAMPPRQPPNCLVGSNPPPPEEGRPRQNSLRPPPPDRDVEERPLPGDQDASVVGIDHLTPAVRCYRSSAGEDPVATPIVDVVRRLSSKYVRPR